MDTSINQLNTCESFPFNIRSRDGIFYLHCESLGITESDKSIESAVAKLQSSRKKLFESLVSAGVDPRIFGSRLHNSLRGAKKSKYFTSFLILYLIIFSIGLGFYAFRSASRALKAIPARLSRSVDKRLDSNQIPILMDKVANTLEGVTPERKAELLGSTRRIVAFLKPFADEIKPLFANSKE